MTVTGTRTGRRRPRWTRSPKDRRERLAGRTTTRGNVTYLWPAIPCADDALAAAIEARKTVVDAGRCPCGAWPNTKHEPGCPADDGNLRALFQDRKCCQ